MFNSHFSQGVKEFSFKLIGAKYKDHEDVIEKLSSTILTKGDYQKITSLFAAYYEAGFLKSIEQQKEAFAQHGLKVTIVGESSSADGPKIFNQRSPDENQK